MKRIKAGAKRPGEPMYRQMTVALIRDRNDLGAVEVAFSESARFYRLLRKNRNFQKILQHLRQAKENSRPVRVLVDFPEGDVIEDVEAGAGL